MIAVLQSAMAARGVVLAAEEDEPDKDDWSD
jgi:hypothetical protein